MADVASWTRIVSPTACRMDTERMDLAMMTKRAYVWTTIMGLAVLLTLLMTMILGTISFIGGNDAWNATTIYFRSAGLIGFAVGLLVVGIGSYFSPRSFALLRAQVASIVFVGGFVVLLIAYLTGTTSVALVTACGALIGIGGALCLVCWTHVLSDDRYLDPIKILFGASIVTLVLYAILHFIPTNMLLIILVAILVPIHLGLLSAVSRVDMYLLVDLEPWLHRDNHQNMMRDIVSPIIALVCAGLISPLMTGMAARAGVSERTQFICVLVALFIVICFFVVVVMNGIDITLTPVFMVGVPIILGLLLVTTTFFTNASAPLLLIFGTALPLLLLLILVPISQDVAHDNYVSLALVYGSLAGILYLFYVIGGLIATPLLATGINDAGITAILVGLFILAMFGVFMVIRRQEKMEFKASKDYTIIEIGPTPDEIKAGCEKTVAEHGYTDEESSILALLSRGGSVEEIAEETGLAKGAVRATIQRLYDDAGVSNRKELVTFMVKGLPQDSDEEDTASEETTEDDDKPSTSRQTKRRKRSYPH